VVSRELGRVAVVGCGSGVAESLAGKLVTVDGNAGEVRSGSLPLSAWSEDNTPELLELADIARRISPLRAHSGGDYPRLELHSEAAVRTALASGHSDVVSASPLLAMLAAIRVSS
jgi:pyruvate,orthophosphate dikinase